MTASRSQKTVKNVFFSLSSNIITQLLHFAVRTVFIYVLGVSYNGLDGLFGNILTMLSLADLGLGVAMAHTYYKPLADGDEEKITALTNLYKKVYFVIGLVVFVAGMSLIPFLPGLIKDMDKVEDLGLNISFIFFWYVLNSAVSYMFAAYKQTLLIADQRQYIVKNIQMYFALLTSVAQIVLLVTFRDWHYTYYLYLITNIVFQIGRNLYIAHKCNKMYPFIRVKQKAYDLSNDIKKLVKDVYSLFLYRICNVVMSASTNIIVANFLSDGLRKIGSYANYNFLIGAVNNLLLQVFESVMASVGNLIAEIKGGSLVKGDERAYSTFKALHFANFWFYGVCAVTLWVMLDPFVHFWIREPGFIYISDAMIFVLVLNFYVFGVQTSTTAFRNAYGLFQQGKYRPVVMAVLNVGLSIWWVQELGLIGVFLGPLVSRLLTVVWFDPLIVHKFGFKRSVLPFYVTYVARIGMLIVIGGVLKYILDMMPYHNILWLVLRGVLAFCSSNAILFVIYFKTQNFAFIKARMLGLIKKIKK